MTTTNTTPRHSAAAPPPQDAPNPDGPLGLRTALLLLAGGSATYIAFLHPAVGAALLVGVAVMTLLHILLARR
ncbi:MULTISPECIES: hypothetical protein [Streptomyces]|uniref:hypothetical protein n=1 Tax=Streptomyces TaxID=1883 RepID=UPI0006EBCFCF|nr:MULTISPECIES: hypothetical protein [Streptomyces]